MAGCKGKLKWPDAKPVRRKSKTGRQENPSKMVGGVLQTLRKHSRSDIPDTEKERPLDILLVEMTALDGQPESHCQFYKQHEKLSESTLKDPGQQFLYLLHYCHGLAI